MKILLSTILGLLLAVTLILNATAAPQPAAAGDPEFVRLKAEKLKKLDERITSLQARRACIEAAADRRAYEVCMDKFKN